MSGEYVGTDAAKRLLMAHRFGLIFPGSVAGYANTLAGLSNEDIEWLVAKTDPPLQDAVKVVVDAMERGVMP